MPAAVNTISKNVPKTGYVGAEGIATPGAFKVLRMQLFGFSENGAAAEVDIKHIVDTYTITTELSSPVVTFSASLRDNESLLSSKDFKICGQERLELIIEPVGTDGDTIKQIFFIKEYPTLTRTLDFPNIQFYTMLAISEFAYRSSLMNICRPLNDGISLDKNIETIFKEDLGIKDFVLAGDPYIKFKGIINIQRPLKAADWLRSRCFEENGSPFFLHNDITKPNTILLSSWKTLSIAPSVATYNFQAFNESGMTGTQTYTDKERRRILSLTSNFKFDRLATANSGGYAGRVNVTDFSAKVYYTLDFKGTETKDWKPLKYAVKDRSGNQPAGGVTMHSIPDANITSIHVNHAVDDSNISNDGVYNSITSSERYMPQARALYARIAEASHEIIVYGNTKLLPGAKIKLVVPKPVRNGDGSSQEDSVSSGEYIVLVSAFIFLDGTFTNKLKLCKLIPSVDGILLSVDGATGFTPIIPADAQNTLAKSGPGVSTSNQKAFYDKAYNSVYKAAVAKGLPNPDVVARLGAAQSAMETRWGQDLPAASNNYFGIKGSTKLGTSNNSTKEFINGKTVTIRDNFRVYESFDESAAGYVDFLVKNPRYSAVLQSKTIDGAVVEIGKSGYATSPTYAQNVGSIAKKYGS